MQQSSSYNNLNSAQQFTSTYAAISNMDPMEVCLAPASAITQLPPGLLAASMSHQPTRTHSVHLGS